MYLLSMGLLVIALAIGCNEAVKPVEKKTAPVSETDKAKYLLAEEPAGTKGVIALREEVKDGDVVEVVGRVGGSKEPIGKDRAYFTIVDLSLKSCKEKGDEDCDTPWDFS
jgi:hypothetical protein